MLRKKRRRLSLRLKKIKLNVSMMLKPRRSKSKKIMSMK
jgi:hypothetical protein